MHLTRLLQISMLTAAWIGEAKPPAHAIYPRWNFQVRSSDLGNDIDHVCFSMDGKGLVWFTEGTQGSVQNQRWELPSGGSIASMPFRADPIPRGLEYSAPIEITWDSPTSPLRYWRRGQEFDFNAMTRIAIPQSAWGRFIKNANPDSWRAYPEWMDERTPAMARVSIQTWEIWQTHAVKAISEDRAWFAEASAAEPPTPLGPTPEPNWWRSSKDRVLRIWRAGTEMPMYRIPLSARVQGLSFSPHAHYLVLAYENQENELWDVQLGVLIGSLPAGVQAKWAEDESCLTYFSPDSQFNRIQIPSLGNDTPIELQGMVLVHYDGPVFSADGRLVAFWSREPIAGKDGTRQIYEVRILVFDLNETRRDGLRSTSQPDRGH